MDLDLRDTFIKGWPALDTMCGIGSTWVGTSDLREKLPGLMRDLNISYFNDCGCGDCSWQDHLPWGDWCVDYQGYDLVARPTWEKQGRCQEADIRKDHMRDCDLAMIRDVFIHLPNDMILEAIENVRKTCKYILISTYSYVSNIRRPGFGVDHFERYNLELPPFSLGKPIREIFEPQWKRTLGLWQGGR